MLIPKNKNYVVFYSLPPFSDNARAMYEYLREKMPKYNFIWLVRDSHSEKLLREKHGLIAYQMKNVIGIWYLLRSSIFFYTHPTSFMAEIKDVRQKYICLWHGMPLKAMGYLDKTEKCPSRRFLLFLNAIDRMIATSSIARNAFCACFGVDPNKIVITGQPRNDFLLNTTDSVEKLQSIAGHSIAEYKTIIFWLPTFRTGYENRIEGKSLLLNFNKEQISRFMEFLKFNNCLLIVKTHINENQQLSSLVNYNNIFVLTNSILQQTGIDLYQLLGRADILVTDYSSVYIDFLLLNKPIIFDVNDYEYYEKVRGFSLSPLEFWLPGPKVKSYEELIDAIGSFLQNPSLYEEQRKLVNSLLNYYTDARSCERVWSSIYI